MLEGKNIVVLDSETAHSADDCRHCGEPNGHCVNTYDPASMNDGHIFEPIGWNNKPALGLSIGCYWDCTDNRIHWFDTHTLEATIRLFVERHPLMVTFNGVGFDFPLMRGLLRQKAEALPISESGRSQPEAVHDDLQTLCDTFKTLCATSYDILAEIWKVDPGRKFERGLNSLDAIAEANGLGKKIGHGAQAPRDWAAGRYADVLNYCQFDVYLTMGILEKIITEGFILRGDGLPLALTNPLIMERA